MPHRISIVCAALLSILAASPALAQRDLRDIPDPDPELERQSFEVAEGFEVNLFAADPALAKPIQMNFDAAGRLWVATSEVYPQIEPGQVANDKIVVLEDADGDGASDRTTVFADGLLIPTGVEPGFGGVYVANSTELVHFADDDGDLRADRRQTVLSGFGTEDTHHIIHTLRWGPDGALYFNQSIYIHSHIETPRGVRRLGGGGIWQFRPATWRLEVFCRGFVNPWGHHFDPWGQSFATDGAYGEGINYVFPGAVFATAPGASRVLPGLNPGSPKHCGLELVGGRHLPDDWQGNAITNDFRGHRVCRFALAEDNSGYASRELPELIKTSHAAFRPIDVKMGPDGAIYIADWYNPIIQHGEVDFRDERRDHVHGRIWRVTARGRPLVARPRLVDAPVEELLEALRAPESWTRHHARRQLQERGEAAVLPALRRWLAALDPSDPQFEHIQVEVLWVYQALDHVEPGLLAAVLRSGDGRARAAGVRVLSAWREQLPDIDAALAAAVADEHPRVRLEAVRALAASPQPRAIEAALAAIDRPTDVNLDFALWLACRELQPRWLPALEAGQLDFGGDARRLAYALEAAGSPSVVGPLLDLVRTGRVPPDREEAVLALIATLGGPRELGAVLELVLGDSLDPARRASLLGALAATSQRRKVLPAGDLSRVAALLSAESVELRAAALRAAGAWKLELLQPAVVEVAVSAAARSAARRAAIEALAALGGSANRDVLIRLTSPDEYFEVRGAAIVALESLDLPAAAQAAIELLASDLRDNDPTAVLASFLARRGGAAALSEALTGRTLDPDAAKLGLRAARSVAEPDVALVDAFSAAGGLTGGPRELSAAEMEQLAAEVRRSGDPQRGETVFRQRDQQCLKCHAIGGAGGVVGPDLLSLGATAQLDYLIDSILAPNKKVKENFHALVVETDDGLISTGLRVRETETELVLRTADDREVTLARDTIVQQEQGGSLMPVGLADTLTRAELVDLVRFLSELGKPGPYAVGPQRVARRWQVRLPDEPGSAGDVGPLAPSTGEPAASNASTPDRWSTVYSLVSGNLSLADVPRQRDSEGAEYGLARFEFDVTTPGDIAVLLRTPEPVIAVDIDGESFEVTDGYILPVRQGRHTVTLAVDFTAGDALRVELDVPPTSGVQAQLVGGK
jgi:putative heme-binding domain-containing protein